MNDFSNFIVPLPDLALIEVTGADAATFLHGQLTHDVTGLASDQARLAGYCTPKGRLLATMVIWRNIVSRASGDGDGGGQTVYLLTKADVARSMAQRLAMFVLRAKVKISVSETPIHGLYAPEGESNDASSGHGSITDAFAPGGVLAQQAHPFFVAHSMAGTWITAPSALGAGRRAWYIPSPTVPLPQPANADRAARALARWQATDIAAGFPWVVAATQDLFIPQTLNLDLIDGVSFTKGCYPGQEVVARSHYRGTVKRRMAYGRASDASRLPQQELAAVDTFDASKPQNPCGRVVNAAWAPAEDSTLSASGNPVAAKAGSDAMMLHLLMEVQLSDLESADFRLSDPNGPVIKLQPMPYQLKAAD